MTNSKTGGYELLYILNIRNKNSDYSQLNGLYSLEEAINQIDDFMEWMLMGQKLKDEYVYTITKVNEKGEIINTIENTLSFRDTVEDKWFDVTLFVNQAEVDDFEEERYEHHEYKGYYQFDDKLIYGIKNIEEYFENISKKYENNNIFLELKPLEKDSSCGNEYRPYILNEYDYKYKSYHSRLLTYYHARLLTYYMTKNNDGHLVLSDAIDIC